MIKIINNHGYSLLELMITLLLSSLVISASIQLFSTVKQSLNTQLEINAIQENGRFTAYYLTQKIHLAGYRPCTTDNQPAIHGYSAASIPDQISIKPIAGTDVLALSQCEEVEQRQQYIQTFYFIANTSYGKAALFAKRASHNRQEITPDIKGMKINYGISDGKDIVRYVTAAHVNNWQQVRAVDIELSLIANNRSPSKLWYVYAALRNP